MFDAWRSKKISDLKGDKKRLSSSVADLTVRLQTAVDLIDNYEATISHYQSIIRGLRDV